MISLALDERHSYTRGLVHTRSVVLDTEQQICPNRTGEYFSVRPVGLFLCVCKVAVIVMALGGNLLVIISVSHFKQLHTPTNFIILSLAMVDFLIGALVLPGQLIEVYSSKTNTVFCYFVVTCTYCMSFLSMYNVSLISLDRLYAIWKPMLYATRVSVKVMSKVIVITWIMSVAYNLGFVYLIVTGSSDVVCRGGCKMALTGMWPTMDVFIAFVIPCSVIILSYLKIFAIVRQHARNIADTDQNTIASAAKLKKYNTVKTTERKAALKLGKLVAVFFISVLPPYLILMISDGIPDAVLQDVHEGASLIHFMHAAINPLFYALFYPWFQKSVKLILMLKVLNRDSVLIAMQ